METSKTIQYLSIATAVLVALGAMIAGYHNIGLPPVVIVGGASVVGMVLWIKTYLRKPLDPRVILPPFLLTVAALELHMAEEYLAGFGPAISRLFDASWTERSFLMIFAFIGPALYTLTALGLFYPEAAGGLRGLFHLHRARRRRVHALHLSAPAAGHPPRPASADLAEPYRTEISSPAWPTTGGRPPGPTTSRECTPRSCR